jgi:hypothetical protein
MKVDNRVAAPVGGGAKAAVGGSSPMPWLSEVPKSKAGPDAESVRALQRKLKEAGFDPGPADGWFGPKTAAAVRKLQQARGLTVDAQVGPQTWGSLGLQGAPRTNPTGAPAPGDLALPGADGPKSGLSLPGAVTTDPGAPPPPSSPHERREDWFLSQQPGPYNPNEDAPGNGNCGPSAVTMVARAFGKVTFPKEGADAAVEETRRRIGESQSEYQGTSIAGLQKALRSYDLDAQVIHNVTDVSKIQAELAKGRLVIAHVSTYHLSGNRGGGHYTVVTGIKDGKVYLNDPAHKQGPMVVDAGVFMESVNDRGTHMMVSVGP